MLILSPPPVGRKAKTTECLRFSSIFSLGVCAIFRSIYCGDKAKGQRRACKTYFRKFISRLCSYLFDATGERAHTKKTILKAIIAIFFLPVFLVFFHIIHNAFLACFSFQSLNIFFPSISLLYFAIIVTERRKMCCTTSGLHFGDRVEDVRFVARADRGDRGENSVK